jgi:hypothetical protein
VKIIINWSLKPCLEGKCTENPIAIWPKGDTDFHHWRDDSVRLIFILKWEEKSKEKPKFEARPSCI